MAGLLVGVLLGLIAVYVVLQPVLQAAAGKPVVEATPLFSDSDDEEDPVMARRDQALAALKEIDFDRATGKLSDADYESLKARFTEEALAAIRMVDAAARSASPAPAIAEPAAVEALIASARVAPRGTQRFCLECGTPIAGTRKFCVECGSPVGVR